MTREFSEHEPVDALPSVQLPEELRRTAALRHKLSAERQAKRLAGESDPTIVAGLIDCVLDPPTARAGVAAIHSLSTTEHPALPDVIEAALRNSAPSLRAAAMDFCDQRNWLTDSPYADKTSKTTHPIARAVIDLMKGDTAWMNRCKAVRLLTATGFPLEFTFYSATDPHWRVRHEFITGALETKTPVADLNNQLQNSGAMPAAHQRRAAGAVEYLVYRNLGEEPTGKFQQFVTSADRVQNNNLPFAYGAGPAVMARRIRDADVDAQMQFVPQLPQFMWHADQRVRSAASDILLNFAEADLLSELAPLLNDVREFGYGDTFELFQKLSTDRLEEVVEFLQNTSTPESRATPALENLLQQSETTRSEAAPPTMSAALDMVADELAESRLQAAAYFQLHLSSPDSVAAIKKLQRDIHPLVRIAALTDERAQLLMKSPEQESSWLVLEAAARRSRSAIWKLRPGPPDRTEEKRQPIDSHVPLIDLPDCPQVELADSRILVSRMGLSGHYRLPTNGFRAARRAGINLMFWEPNYDTMTRFMRDLQPSDRQQIHIMAGSFSADPRGVKRDIENVLRNLRIETITLFLMFWVRSWERIADDVVELLHEMQAAGKIRRFSLSTHNRPLAIHAIEQNWNPLMVRHSLAHRGAEETIFPAAMQREKGGQKKPTLITFNNTCYGRLLKKTSRLDRPPTAAECYQYTLSQPAVAACLTAPTTIEHLQHNLTAMNAGPLDAPRLADLVEHGDAVYQQDSVFRRTVRSV